MGNAFKINGKEYTYREIFTNVFNMIDFCYKYNLTRENSELIPTGKNKHNEDVYTLYYN